MQISGSMDVLKRLVRGVNDGVRRVLYAGPGAMRGAAAGGVTSEFEAHNLVRHVHVGVGVSTGALAIAYPVAGQAALGTSIYAEECTTREFISLQRFLAGGPPADTCFINGVFQHSPTKALNRRAVLESATEFYVGITDALTGVGSLENAKTAKPGMMEAIEATTRIPISAEPVMLNGSLSYDGSIGCPFPVREIIRRFNPTDLIILANRVPEYRENSNLARRTIEQRLIRHTTPALQAAFASRGELYEEELEYLKSQTTCDYLIFWGDPRLRSMTRNPRVIRQVITDVRAQTRELILESSA
jgi:predicted patatin/cPLA2 family phospholipase